MPTEKKKQKNKVVSVESNSSNGEDSPEIIQEDLGTEGAIEQDIEAQLVQVISDG